MSVLVVGSVALDTIQTPFGNTQDALGGSAVYFSYTASFFSPVRLVAVVGSDFPRSAIKLLRERDISIDGLETAQGKTFRWTGSYENDMNSAITHETALNVFQTFNPKIPADYLTTPHVFLANIHPDLQIQVLSQMKAPDLVGCDTMNLWISTEAASLNRLLQKVHIFFLNEGEARQLTGITNLIKAGRDLLARGPKTVVIKKGEHGSLLMTRDFTFISPAYPAENVMDPTGAGDCFAGGFFGYLSSLPKKPTEANLKTAVAVGTVMASFNIESFSLDRLRGLKTKEILERLETLRTCTTLPYKTADIHFRKIGKG